MTQEQIIRTYVPVDCKPEVHGNIVAYEIKADELAVICHELHVVQGFPIKTVTAADERKSGKGFTIFYVFGLPKENVFLVPYIVLKDTEEFPSLTPIIHEVSGYERRIKTFFGLNPAGHPNPQSLLLHENWPANVFPLRKDFDWQERPEKAHTPYEFYRVHGEGIYEIPVGPIHAGIIEPGHFRFSVAGEEIILLEPRLGYKHKGIEKLFETFSLENAVKLAERVSGDTSFTHSLAFCQATESLSGIVVPERAAYVRVIFSELERLANHFGDIGFIMQDTGYSFGGSNGARLRETIMRWNEKLTGSRFLRGVNVVGGVARDIPSVLARELLEDLRSIDKDFNEVIEISEDTISLINRLEDTGRMSSQVTQDYGVIGVAGRAVGIRQDSRIDYPYAAYEKLPFDISLEEEGDVYARFHVRVKEVNSSMKILEQALSAMPASTELRSLAPVALKKNALGIGIAEAWRGEVVYFVVTDAQGNIARVDVRDPSFLNWPAVGEVGKGNVVPDFPLINKSFNLSYSGNDL
ncbi:MAG: NADH-quinone oxidoreductase subunit C [Candidatus Wildermuthbacteria bacterium]|nr:NADH-quinone oxidoreductase subunit C [Candidatus Wildermuthbacteria bacterium]